MPRRPSQRFAATTLVSLLALCMTVIGVAAAGPGSISFTNAAFTVDEGGGNATITLSRGGGTDGAVTAKVTPTNGTAGSADYRFTPGALDTSFNFNNSGPNDSVSAVLLLSDGKILVGGGFSKYNGTNRNGVARLNADGTLDTMFVPPAAPTSAVCVAVQPDGKVLVGGNLSHLNGSAPMTGITRLNADGSTDMTFDPGTGAGSSQVRGVAVQPDGKIIIAGLFNSYNGVTRNGVARLNSNGSLDPTFDVGAGPTGEIATVYSMLLQPDGKILIGGPFDRFNFIERDCIVRLNTDGSVDNTFVPPNRTPRFMVYGLALQPDGKVVVGGTFFAGVNFNGANPTAMARFNADGSKDNSFVDPGLGRLVVTQWIVRQPDGKLIIGGNRRETPGGELFHHLNRLNPDGTKDTSFNEAAIAVYSTGFASGAAMQPDGKILVGGMFSYNPFNAADRRYLLRVDGDIFVNWASGDGADKTFRIPVTDDAIHEEDETVNLTLTPLTEGVTAGAVPAATLTIIDNDPLLQFGSETYSVSEGAGSLSVPVVRVGAPTGQSTVSYSIVADTATPNADLTVSSGTLTFAPGETSKNISVPLVNDAVNELDESFRVLITNVTGGVAGITRTTVTINDDDPLPTLTVGDVTLTEGDFGTTVASFTVTRNGLIDRPVVFTLSTADGTARAGEDYVTFNFQTGIAPQFGSINANVTVYNDTIAEPDKSFFLNLTSPANATVADGQGVCEIKDNDTTTGAPTVQFAAREFKGSEGAGVIQLTVTRAGDASAPATIAYATNAQGGGFVASERSDYTLALGTLRFGAGETSKTLNLFVTDDAYVEGDELLSVSLSGATGTSVGNPATANVRINDNDAAPSATNPIDETQFFVRQHYRDFLNRDPDDEGFQFWTQEIEQCGEDAQCREVKRINVSAAFFLSIEFQQTGYFDYLLYKAAFNTGERLPLRTFLSDTQEIGRDVVVGAEGWELKLASNKQAFADAFVARSNFTTAFPTTLTPTQFVDALNANTGDPLQPDAGGALTQAERDALVAGLTAGTLTRAQVLRAVAENEEFRRRQLSKAFVYMQYVGYLRRAPNESPDSNFNGYNFWLGKLNEFNCNYIAAEMVKAFLSAPEYRQRFGQ
ncbi:MAG TPA: Calx-beta domain-containing protein [Pyrinomonadaceae bacterium]